MAFHETDRYIPGDIGNACWFCGSGQRSDLGIKERLFRCDRDIEWEGFVVICEHCASDLAGQLGWMSPDAVAALKAKNNELQKQVKASTRALNASEETVRALRVHDEVLGG